MDHFVDIDRPLISTNQKPGAAAASAAPVRGQKSFPKGGSGNPKNRPNVRRNQAVLMAQTYFDAQGEAIVGQILELALQKGDPAALKICLDRLLPPRKARSP